MARRLSSDWQALYGHPVHFLETFTDDTEWRPLMAHDAPEGVETSIWVVGASPAALNRQKTGGGALSLEP